ncbi:hypothetical protein ACQFX9_14360 [Aliinostoc sp. HNIBRCY26]|uniref:hypothetical protein n=1 Tax=Aliinostoc sp. HNIBRCY26 TaxID=3418997 RepID=UPI003D091BBE
MELTIEQVQALIDEKFAVLKEEVTAANKGLAASLTKDIKKALASQSTQSPEGEIQEDSNKLTLKSLQQKISDLTNQLAQKDKEAFNAKKSQAVSQAIASLKTLGPSALQKLFLAEYSDSLREENGSWFIEKGDSVFSLQDALNNYLNTEEGKCFLPASGVKGSDSIETKPTQVSTEQKLTGADALMQAFVNI